MKKTKKITIIICIVIVVTILGICAFNTKIITRKYILESNKINETFKICFVADLHSCNYGEGDKKLLTAIENRTPDVVLFGGDIFDDKLPMNSAFDFCRALVKKYPCYYVTGNHEYWSEQADKIKKELDQIGVIVLCGDTLKFEKNSILIQICGIDDPCVGSATWNNQLVNCANALDNNKYSILLTHRPELINTYRQYDFDLVLSGHAHGGQWRIPFILNGLYAPDQGFFPKYAGGQYKFEKQTMIVSRGLSRESTRVPRIFNRPELVMITIK